MRRTKFFGLVLAAGVAACATTPILAADLFWEATPVAGGLTDANYFNGALAVGDQVPTSADNVYIGLAGDVTLNTPGQVDFAKLWVGHGVTTTTGYVGAGTLTVSNGAKISVSGGLTGNPGFAVGDRRDGTLTIDGPDSSVTSNQLIELGMGNALTRQVTVNITNGGSLIATTGNINMGIGSGTTSPNGVPANVNLNGTMTALGSAADITVGNHVAKVTMTMTGGSLRAADLITIGAGGSTGSSLTVSGGIVDTGVSSAAGNLFVGRGTTLGGSVNATLNVSGTAVVNVGNRLLIGSSPGGATPSLPAGGATVNQTGGTINTVLNLVVGDANADNSFYNFSDGAINAGTGGNVGRQGTATFTHTGGVANFNGQLSVGNREAAALAANGTYRISGGELNAGNNSGGTGLSIGQNGTGEFRVVGDDASIDVFGNLILGNTANGIGTLAFEFETGDSLSMINVVNNATFASGSKLVLDADPVAPALSSYDLVTAALIDDQGLIFEGPAGWSHSIVTVGANQVLRVTGPGGPTEDADFDGDGDVDGSDFLTWQRGLGVGTTKATGDANGSNTVDSADLAIWRSQYGPASVAAVGAVPEPSSILMLLAGVGIAGAARRGLRRS